MDKINMWCVPYALGKLTGKTSNEIAALIADERGDGNPDKVRRVAGSLWVIMLPKLGIKTLAYVQRPHMTLATWAAVRAKWRDAAPWLVRVRGHALIYRDGLFYDNTSPEGVTPDKYPYRKSRIESARQVDSWNNANPLRLA